MIITEKRIRKMPIVFEAPQILKKKKLKHVNKRNRPNSCQYETIAMPPKYNHLFDTNLLCGNLPFTRRDNHFYTDLSLLNEFHTYHQAYEVNFAYNNEKQKLLHIVTERRTDVSFPRWKATAKNLINHKSSEARSWGRCVRDYSSAYERLIAEHLAQAGISQINEERRDQRDLSWMDEVELKAYKDNIMSEYPFIMLKTQFRGFENRLHEIVVSEKLLEILGYTNEEFACSVLKEGLPQLMPFTLEDSSDFLNSLLNQYIDVSSYSFRSQEINTQLITKCGFMKNVRIEVNIMMTYENGNHGSETIFIVKESSLGGIVYGKQRDLKINVDFVKKMIQKEEEQNSFLLKYYDGFNSIMKYSNQSRICKIRDLSS